MHLRFTFWVALVFAATAGIIRAQTPAAAADAFVDGQIRAKDVHGSVVMEASGVKTELHNDDAVVPHSKIITGSGAKVILVFSNGASTQLGADTVLDIEEFLQKPFSSDLNLATLTEEPTVSKTRLKLSKGELLGKVAHLKREQGSDYTVQTPVGAAGIRGTTFHIVFIPEGNGQAFRFTLATVEGNVAYQASGSSGPSTTPGTTPAPGATEGGGVPVPKGEQVTVTVNVTVDPVTNVVTVTAPSTVSSTVPISASTLAALTSQAETIATTAAQTTFTAPTTPTPGTGGSTTNGDNGGEKKKDGDSSNGSTTDGSSSGGTSTGGSSTGSGSTSSGSTAGGSANAGGSTGGTPANGGGNTTGGGSNDAPANSRAPTPTNPTQTTFTPPTPTATTGSLTFTPGAGK
jgi:hypothetical protein